MPVPEVTPLAVALVALAAFAAGVVQRVTGLAYILVLLGPIVLVYGPHEGITIAVALAIIASLVAVFSALGHIDWARTGWLLLAGVITAPAGAFITRMLPEVALLFVIAAMAIIALLAPRLTRFSRALHGRRGAVIAGATAGFMHASSGLSGPALAAFAVGDRWDQRRFAASVQIVFLGYGVVSVALRGLPTAPWHELAVLGAATAVGILVGAWLVTRVSIAFARAAMLAFAWLGTAVVLIRGIVALIHAL
ncbi:TSUP family transporter [Microbacterium sp. YY-01]|uniref:TSUP family transporter n=1 Tax=Microbacterium sp. YY-01 TaxID=3421634 RepID=UPI003D17A104